MTGEFASNVAFMAAYPLRASTFAIAELRAPDAAAKPPEPPDQYRSAGMRTMTPLYPLRTAATPARSAA